MSPEGTYSGGLAGKQDFLPWEGTVFDFLGFFLPLLGTDCPERCLSCEGADCRDLLSFTGTDSDDTKGLMPFAGTNFGILDF